MRTPDELAAIAEQRRVDALFRDIFETDKRGAEIFEILYRRFAAKAKVHTAGGIDAVLKTYQDAAHREVIEFIVAACNRANGVDDSPNPPGENDDD
ncbi:hypothetical protein [Hydrogenophaga sp.]|uniref:hypothetical protein n=1 Tax=Hydrogenophaga sp. TaxID=1904254 RepID=UPI003F7111D8